VPVYNAHDKHICSSWK